MISSKKHFQKIRCSPYHSVFLKKRGGEEKCITTTATREAFQNCMILINLLFQENILTHKFDPVVFSDNRSSDATLRVRQKQTHGAKIDL